MIITVKGADFSDCSIGVFVPTELRTKLENAYSNISEEQIVAITVFLNTIGYSGKNQIYSKLKSLMLPIVSANLNEAIYDFVKGATASVSTTNLSFNDTTKQLTASASVLYDIGQYDIIKLNTFAYSKTTAAANSMDEYGGSFVGKDKLGVYFGVYGQLLFKSFTASKAIVLVTAPTGATSLNSLNIKLLRENNTVSITEELTYPSAIGTKVIIANAGDHDAQDAILGWAEGLTLEEGTILRDALVALGNALS